MFNPFDLYGPEFLLFYIVMAVVLNVLFYSWVRRSDSAVVLDPRGRVLMRDPYMVAYLRGGAAELLKVAIFGMSERGLLLPSKALVQVNQNASGSITHLIERQIAAQCGSARNVHDLANDSKLQIVATLYAAPMKEYGLIAGQAEYQRRLPMGMLFATVLFALAVIKIIIAFSRGRHNVIFLVILCVVALIVTAKIFFNRKTKYGTQALEMQQILFKKLLNRVKKKVNADATNETILVAATFGFNALPKSKFPFAFQLRRDPRQNSSSSSCSSSCGSSCGGGCGGGCGGCGS